MMPYRYTCWILVVAVCNAFAWAEETLPKGSALTGKWVVTTDSYETSVGTVMIFDADSMQTITPDGRKLGKVTVSTDISQIPARISCEIMTREGVKFNVAGIYRVEEGILTMCLDAEVAPKQPKYPEKFDPHLGQLIQLELLEK